MLRIIQHGDHTDIEQNFDGVWAVISCNIKLETQMRHFAKPHAPRLDYFHVCKCYTVTMPMLDGTFFCPTCMSKVTAVKMSTGEYYEQVDLQRNITIEAQDEYLRQADEIAADAEWLADAAEWRDEISTREDVRL